MQEPNLAAQDSLKNPPQEDVVHSTEIKQAEAISPQSSVPMASLVARQSVVDPVFSMPPNQAMNQLLSANPTALAVLHSVNRHQSRAALMGQLEFATSSMLGQISNIQCKMDDRMDQATVIRSMLHVGETILNEINFVQFDSVVFQPHSSAMQWPVSLTNVIKPGLVNLTSERIIFSSNTTHRGMGMEMYGNPKASDPGGYILSASSEDTAWVFPFNVSQIKHISMSASSGAKASTQIVSNPPFCRGLCSCCCPKKWTPVGWPAQAYNIRVITMVVDLPLFSGPTTVTISVNQNTRLSSMTSLIQNIQRLKAPERELKMH